eukprot:349740-Chlamydomonas_euryale.AAC.2
MERRTEGKGQRAEGRGHGTEDAGRRGGKGSLCRIYRWSLLSTSMPLGRVCSALRAPVPTRPSVVPAQPLSRPCSTA